MIDLLRFIGVMNAAVWFGSALYHVLGVGPAMGSVGVQRIFGAGNGSYFAFVVEHVLLGRLFYLHLACGSVAVLHAFTEWLYLGRMPRRWWAALLAGLFALNLLTGLWLDPYLSRLNTARAAVNFSPERRMAAGRAFVIWDGAADLLRAVVLIGSGVYLWRTVNPAPGTRFSSTAKFRS